MLLVCFLFFVNVFFCLKPTAQMANIEASQVYLTRSCWKRVCLFLIEVCLCDCVLLLRAPVSLAVVKTRELPIFKNLEPQVQTEAIDPLHQGIDWYQGHKLNMHRFVLNLMFYFSFFFFFLFFFEYCTDDCCWKVGFYVSTFYFFLNRKKTNTTKYYCINICSRW